MKYRIGWSIVVLSCLAASAAGAEGRIAYPPTRRVEQTDEYFGVRVADPYRWLEEDVRKSAAVAEWVAAENAVTRRYLDSIPQREQIRRRITALWNFTQYGRPCKAGGRYYYLKNDGLQNQAVLYVMDSLEGRPRVLLDPNTWSKDGTIALGGLAASDDGRYLAYCRAEAGSDWLRWQVLEIDSGKLLPDELRWTKSPQASWSRDGQGFFYSRDEQPKAGSEFQSLNFNNRLCYHRLGTPQRDDAVVYFRPEHPQWQYEGTATEDGRYLVITTALGTDDRYRITVKDLATPAAAPIELIDNFEHEYTFVGNDGPTLYFKTDLDAPRGRLIAVDLDRPAARNWREIVPQAEATLVAASFVGDRFILSYLHDVQPLVKVFTREGAYLRDVPLPGIGAVTGFEGKRIDEETFYTFSSFATPPSLYHYDVASGRSSLFRRAEGKFNPDDFEVRQVFYTGKDGARVPMFIAAKKGIVRDGSNPALLYGYGGFNISLEPAFAISRVAWMEMGGVYAQANLRGGGEFGDAWHKAGTKLHKQNVFDDFIAAAEWLIAQKYTRRQRLAIQGGSNGGLLVGAVMTQRPDLFGACLPAVGVMDMLRFQKFTEGRTWVDDYGSAADSPAQFRALLAYSPYHNVRPGTCYPSTLITTADTDDRVIPGHSFKFAAALQAAQACDNPVLIRIETRAGHGAGKPTGKRIAELTDLWAFLVKSLKIDLPDDRQARVATRVAVLASGAAGVDRLAPLVEVRLAQQPAVTLVNRQDIKEVLREQELQALMAAAGTAKRTRLGKILQADLLVLIEGEEEPRPHARVVICETRQGLRLYHRPVEFSADAEADARAVAQAVDQAMMKNAEQIRELIAVPPFVSRDLGFESQALQRPMANVLEQMLLDRPGVLVVELAEAKAVADELALAGGETPQRRLPLYLLGDFQRPSNEAGGKLAIHLRLLRGQKLLARRDLQDVAEAELGAVLRREAAALVDTTAPGAAVLPAPATEARQLARRAVTMYQLMNFLECLELAEASLLVQPDQPDIHRLAAHAAGMYVSRLLRLRSDQAQHVTTEALVQAVMRENEATLRRGLPHLEYFLKHAAVSATRDRMLIFGYFETTPLKEDVRAMMLRVLAAKCEGKVMDDTIMYVRPFRKRCFPGMPPEEILRWKLAAARAWPRADAQGVVNLVDLVTYGTDGKDCPQLRDLVARLRAISNPACAPAAWYMEERWKSGRSATPDVLGDSPPPNPPATAGPEVKLLPVAQPPGIIGRAAAADMDLAWTGRELFLAKGSDPADLSPAAHIFANEYGTSVAFDGKYVWALQNPADQPVAAGQEAPRQPRVLVLDPPSGQQRFLTPDCGLPPMELRALSLAPLGVGKVCLVGHFGAERMTRVWFAIAQLDFPSGRGSVKVFHDARNFPPVRHVHEEDSTHMAFSRGRAIMLTEKTAGAERPRQRIIVDRHYVHPLLIDPETLAVEVSDETIQYLFPGVPLAHDGAMYWIGKGPQEGRYRVDRFGFPDFKVHRGDFDVPMGRLAFYKQWTILLDNSGRAWIAAAPQGPYRQFRTTRGADAKGQRPDFEGFQLFAGHHDGLLAYDQCFTFEVVLPPEKELAAALRRLGTRD
jgi:prolyl oligopeptidase